MRGARYGVKGQWKKEKEKTHPLRWIVISYRRSYLGRHLRTEGVAGMEKSQHYSITLIEVRIAGWCNADSSEVLVSRYGVWSMGKKEKGKRIKMRPENQADVRLTLFTLTNKLINQLTWIGYKVRGKRYEVWGMRYGEKGKGKKDKDASRKSGGCSIDPFHINK